MTVYLTLPAPPSVNACFRNLPGKGRVKTDLYKRWQSEASWRLRLQTIALHLREPVVLVMGVERTSNLADVDNRIKAAQDLLVAEQVLEDDRFVIGLAIAWNPTRDNLMRLEIVPASEPITLQFQLADQAHGGWYRHAPQPEQEAA